MLPREQDEVRTVGEELGGRDEALDGSHQTGLTGRSEPAVGGVHEGLVDLVSDLSHRRMSSARPR